MKRVFVLQHVANEGAGTMTRHMEERGIAFSVLRLFEGAALPDPSEVAALLVMGGPMNVYEEDKFPFLKPETELVRVLAEADVPILGVCLGSQLIAKALGKKVYKAAVPEVGWQEVTLTEEGRRDPVFSTVPSGKPLKVLQWHEDTFDVPEGGSLLASSGAVPHQAYRYKQNVYGFQFHLEADGLMIAEWFKDRPDGRAILNEYMSYRPELEKIVSSLYESFFGRLGARLIAGTA